MKWISVKDRLPSIKEINTYFVKQRMKDSYEDWFPGACTFSGDWEISEGYEVIEWLDETPTEGEIYSQIEKLENSMMLRGGNTDQEKIEWLVSQLAEKDKEINEHMGAFVDWYERNCLEFGKDQYVLLRETGNTKYSMKQLIEMYFNQLKPK